MREIVNETEEIKTVPFITDIPENTVALEINATIFKDGEIQRMTMTIDDMNTIRNQIIKGQEYEDENVVYMLTDEARKELEHEQL